jgi:DNA (cytosine-5)-methyltransferase 1
MQQRLTHIDLFSGIGGFALASAWAGFETVVFCEKDKYCHKILNKHWPDVPIVKDIHEFDGSRFAGATLLTGGVPCQPASVAGRQRGTEDDRWLWPEALRVIGEARPEWVILENVRGLISLNGGVEFDNLLTEVEAIGYETRAFIIPACSVNAPHRRERVWIVANSRYQRILKQQCFVNISGQSRELGRIRQDGLQKKQKTESEVLADTPQRSSHDKQPNAGVSPQAESSHRKPRNEGEQNPLVNPNNSRFFKQWRGITIQPEVSALERSSGRGAFSYLGQLANGFSPRLVGPEPNIPRINNEKDRGRVNKLRALGNAIVPQVAHQIIEKIAIIEMGKCRPIDSSSAEEPSIALKYATIKEG